MTLVNFKYIIGIDAGTRTGIAVFNTEERRLTDVKSLPIHKALDFIKLFKPSNTLIRVEDARKRKWFGDRTNSKLQGAGSVKRDCSIWEAFLKDEGFMFQMVHPIKGATKMNAQLFKTATKWGKTTNQHGRDAAMLVFNYQ